MQISLDAKDVHLTLFRDDAANDLREQLAQHLASLNLTPEEVDREFRALEQAIADSRLLEEKALAAERREARERMKWARAEAEKLGLDAWGVLLHPRVPTEHYLEFEQLIKQTRWFVKAQDPSCEYHTTGWVVRHPGTKRKEVVSPYDVTFYIRLSGGNAQKLDLLLALELGHSFARHRLKDFEKMSAAGLAGVLAGVQWLSTRCRSLLPRMTPSALQSIGIAESALRWALIGKHVELGDARRTGIATPKSKRVTRQNLDWTTARAAAANPALRFSLMPPTDQWSHLFGFAPPEGLTLVDLSGFKVKVFRALCPVMRLKLTAKGIANVSNGRQSSKPFADEQAIRRFAGNPAGNAQPLFNLVRLFGDEQAIRRFVRDSGFPWTTEGIHDAGQFTLPASRNWTPVKWASLCLRAPAAVRYASEFARLELNDQYPSTLAMLRRAVTMLGYPCLAAGDEPLAEVCLAAELSGDEFRQYKEFWATVKVKTAEFLPQATVCGEEVGLPAGWRFTKLSPSDYRGPMLGQLTGCCQHLSAAGAASARHGVESPYSAFYVVTHEGKVIAQTWAWLSTSQGIVFDSIESRVREPVDLQPVFRLFEEGARRILQAPLSIKYVALGDSSSGVTSQAMGVFADKKGKLVAARANPADGGGYYDGIEQVIIVGKAPRKKERMPEVEGYRRRPHVWSAEDFGDLLAWDLVHARNDFVLAGRPRDRAAMP